jgi:hypothetical protein
MKRQSNNLIVFAIFWCVIFLLLVTNHIANASEREHERGDNNASTISNATAQSSSWAVGGNSSLHSTIGVSVGGSNATAISGPQYSSSGASMGEIKNDSAGGNVQIQGNKYPNQAPTIFSTSAPSYSQRNCTPVGSVNASGPLGGLGFAFPMGGDVCNGLNESDKIAEWERESGDAKLWLVQCNLMIQKDSDLADAFEDSGYSCKDAYIKRQADANARAKMSLLQH